MKTPREILLAQHRAAETKLDALRQSVVATSRPNATINNSQASATFFQILWQELFLPSRRFWTGTAAIWIFILIVNFAQHDGVDSVTGRAVHSSGPVMSLQAQQRWMNELFADRAVPSEADRPRHSAPKPHTQTAQTATV